MPGRKQKNRGILFEGELDAIKFAQECGTKDIYGMASGAIGIPYSSKAHKRIQKFSKIIVCSDNDDAGEKAASNLMWEFPDKRVFYVPVPVKYGNDITEAFMNGLTVDEFKKCLKEQTRNYEMAF